MLKLEIIQTNQDVAKLLDYLKDKKYVALDTETTGLNKSDTVIGYSVCAEESKAFYVILEKWNTITNSLESLETKSSASHFFAEMLKKDIIGHNFIFDAMMIESNFKIRIIDSLHTDTMILAHLLDENRRVGLKELAYQKYGEAGTQEAKEMRASIIANGGNVTKKSYELYKADAYLIAKYGAKDAWLTYKLFLDLVPELFAKKLDKFFYEEESMPLLRGPTYDLNTTGLTVDTQELQKLKKTLEVECLEAKDFITQEIAVHVKAKYSGTNKKNLFNIGSSAQLSWLLFGALGLDFSSLTKGGKTICRELGLKLPYTPTARRAFIQACIDSEGQVYQPEAIVNGKKVRAKKFKAPWSSITCDKTTLKKLAPKHKWIEVLLQYQQKNKLLNTYIKGTEERIHYGVVTSSYLQHGTMTGRYASRNPNLQNLPRDDQRIKGCFVARPGKSFVSADFSQLEPRVFSYYSGDTRLMQAFDGSADFYSVVGIDVFEVFDAEPTKEDFGKKYKHYRDDSKTIALAAAYGATPPQLAPKTGKSIEETREIMERYFEKFPGVRKMMVDAHNIVKEKGEVSSLFGRVRHIPEAKQIVKLYGESEHWDLPYNARKLLNMACNHRIQSTGASIVNRAAIKFYNECNRLSIKAKLVSQIHDELVAECFDKDTDAVSTILRDAMENTTVLSGINFEAIPRITKNLAK